VSSCLSNKRAQAHVYKMRRRVYNAVIEGPLWIALPRSNQRVNSLGR